MVQRLGRSRPLIGVDRETRPHEVLRGVRYVRPVLSWLKFVVTCDDGLHLLLLIFPVEGRVTFP